MEDVSDIRFDQYRGDKYLRTVEQSYMDRKNDHWTVKLPPGFYKAQIEASGEVYPTAERDGVDISGKLFEVKDTAQQPEIRIILKKGGSISGQLTNQGRPGSSYVYTVPADPSGRIRFGYYQGTFKVQELPPGKYLLFATPDQLTPDPLDAKTLDHWRPLGKPVTLKSGQDASIDLDVQDVK